MIKKGYTLAETLITLAIIGVIAAILTPAVINAQPNREMVAFKKAYKQASRVLHELANDEDFYDRNKGFTDDTQVSYNGVSYGGVGNTPAAKHAIKLCGLLKSRFVITSEGDCTNEKGRWFETSDGALWRLRFFDTNSSSINFNRNYILIDVNGSSRGNNCMESAPPTTWQDDVSKCEQNDIPDTFRINFSKFGAVQLPENGIEQKYIDETSNTKKYKDLKD